MKILPTTIVEHAPMPPRGDHQLRFGQLNAHNFFDTRDDPSTQDPVLDRAAYREHVSKLAAAIRDGLGAPDVITMQEVENVKVLKDLVASEAIRDLGYVPVLREGTDPRGIDNAILYRPDAVTLTQVMQIDPLRMNDAGRGSRLFTRPPLVATFAINGRDQATRGVREVNVIAAHLTSKLGGADAAAKRLEQASVIARFAQGLQAVDPGVGVLVAGDFNMERSEPEFAPLRHTVKGAALVDATASIPSRKRFTWRDGHKHLQLDHVLVSKNIAPNLDTVVIPHISTRISKGAASDPVRAEGYSDHDPVVATFAG
ncbi:MAG: endonuclease/exonuclease/phosphatase family protein [Thermoleophilia bacterium]|nr:endonuclease/exonuclease/phosphatase family protein [Thermoleophilia bacterium]